MQEVFLINFEYTLAEDILPADKIAVNWSVKGLFICLKYIRY
jgi:hypothetical protein